MREPLTLIEKQPRRFLPARTSGPPWAQRRESKICTRIKEKMGRSHAPFERVRLHKGKHMNRRVC
jgi:hypothetical protein